MYEFFILSIVWFMRDKSMKEIRISSSRDLESLRELTLGRMRTAGYELLDIDENMDNAVNIKVESFDEYMKLLNKARAKFVFCYKHNGIVDEEQNKYIDMYSSIGGVLTVVRICFVDINKKERSRDSFEKVQREDCRGK